MPVHTFVALCALNGGVYYATWDILFFFLTDVPLVAFIYLVFIRMPGGITEGDSGHCCCAPCLSRAILSICLLIVSSVALLFCLI